MWFLEMELEVSLLETETCIEVCLQLVSSLQTRDLFHRLLLWPRQAGAKGVLGSFLNFCRQFATVPSPKPVPANETTGASIRLSICWSCLCSFWRITDVWGSKHLQKGAFRLLGLPCSHMGPTTLHRKGTMKGGLRRGLKRGLKKGLRRGFKEGLQGGASRGGFKGGLREGLRRGLRDGLRGSLREGLRGA